MGQILPQWISGAIRPGYWSPKRLDCRTTISPLLRKRAYTRLAEDFHVQRKGALQPEAMERALKSLAGFASVTKKIWC